MAAFSTYFFAGISKEGLSIPDVKANIDTLGSSVRSKISVSKLQGSSHNNL